MKDKKKDTTQRMFTVCFTNKENLYQKCKQNLKLVAALQNRNQCEVLSEALENIALKEKAS